MTAEGALAHRGPESGVVQSPGEAKLPGNPDGGRRIHELEAWIVILAFGLVGFCLMGLLTKYAVDSNPRSEAN